MTANGVQVGFDIAGAIGFVLSVSLVILEVVRNRTKIEITKMKAYALPQYGMCNRFFICGIYENHSDRPIAIRSVSVEMNGEWMEAVRYEQIILSVEGHKKDDTYSGHEEFLSTPFPVNLPPRESCELRLAFQADKSWLSSQTRHPWVCNPLGLEYLHTYNDNTWGEDVLHIRLNTSRKLLDFFVPAEIHAYGEIEIYLETKSKLRINAS